jgi:RimJ/RimL family protein N-acetyltransferase
MRHSLFVEGYGVRLRPVRLDDAAFIVWLRNLDFVKGRVGDSAADVASQETWLKSYFEKQDDYYFIVETLNEIPVGTSAIYDVKGTSAEMGRLIIRAGVPAAVPTSFLVFDLAFGQMGLTKLRATSVASNRKLHSYIRRLGFRQVKVEHAGRVIGGQAIDMVHFIQTAEDWFRVREQIIPLARLAETQVREWEQAHLQNRGSQGLVTET